MKLKLTLLFVVFTTLVFSQTDDLHKISLKDKKDVALDYAFSVENVIDGRQFKHNIGTVQKGAFNRKVLADFETSLPEEFLSYFAVICPKKDNKPAIVVRINDLYVSELTRAFSETGYATVVIDVIEIKNGVSYVVGTYTASTESNGVDVTNKHDERLKSVIQQCLNDYVKTSEKDKTNIVYDSALITTVNEKTFSVPKKGVYLSYSDVFNDKPISDNNFEISNKNDKFYLINKKSNEKELNYYGFSDGDVFYINVSKYANSKYYAKTEIIADKYFIENVVYNQANANAMAAMFGLVGALIATSDTSVPMLIDCNTGQPSFLSKSEIKIMLGRYPELLKEYKKSDKTNSDIKNILTKYYKETKSL
ncbi:DUF6563 family protein [Flavobacterium seoulense]|uniref:Uncharacterized protein n=1 Tax=Flavobacterium seoulense TaxID=1492738 RepID=A0A066WTD7_9FLAO|nr:DUF6563 family protein [Flavobacterium seoulense]KDN54249.1 hypothetical protein FEM21_26240 [Flavobacterium seoulense]